MMQLVNLQTNLLRVDDSTIAKLSLLTTGDRLITVVGAMGYGPNDLLAMPYDFVGTATFIVVSCNPTRTNLKLLICLIAQLFICFQRLTGSALEERDKFFTQLKNRIEVAVDMQPLAATESGLGAVVMAHSLGNNIFRFFLEWLEHRNPTGHQAWLDHYIDSYVAASAPFLGAPEPSKALFTGQTFGLPGVTISEAREMASTFSSSPWMLPYEIAEAQQSLLHRYANGNMTSFPASPMIRATTKTWSEERTVGSASDFVTFVCVLCTLRTHI
jgi:hypothetical protein